MWMQNYAKFESNVVQESLDRSYDTVSVWGWYYWSSSSIFDYLMRIIDTVIEMIFVLWVIIGFLLFFYFVISLFRKWWDETVKEMKRLGSWWVWILKDILLSIKKLLLYFWNRKLLSVFIIIICFLGIFVWRVLDWRCKVLRLAKIESGFVWVDLKNQRILTPWYHLYSPIRTSYFLSPTSNFAFEIVEITANTDGELPVTLDYRVNFMIKSDKRLEFYDKYWAKSIREVSSDVVMPSLLEVIKGIIKDYDFKEISSKHNEIKDITIKQANEILKEIWIEIQDINILDIRLPESYLKSKEDLLKAENELKLAEAKLEAQKKESERNVIEAENAKKVKIIEAEAIAEYNKIINSETITDKMLEMKKLENETTKIKKWDGKLPTSVWGDYEFLR